MDDNKDHIEEVLGKIGEQLKELRKTRSSMHYKDFATKELKMAQNTYHRMEKGNVNYKIGNLIHIIAQFPDLKLSQFLADAGL